MYPKVKNARNRFVIFLFNIYAPSKALMWNVLSRNWWTWVGNGERIFSQTAQLQRKPSKDFCGHNFGRTEQNVDVLLF